MKRTFSFSTICIILLWLGIPISVAGTTKAVYVINSTMFCGVINNNKSFQVINKISVSCRNESDMITFDTRRNMAFWLGADKTEPTVYSHAFNTSKIEVVVDKGLRYPISIAYDWIAENIYILEKSFLNLKIVVCNPGFPVCAVVYQREFSESIKFLRFIVLDPIHGFMYWTTEGNQATAEDANTNIFRAGMDGTNPEPIVLDDLVQPLGMTIDYREKRLYWFDASREVVESSQLNGKDRRVVLYTSDLSTGKYLNIWRGQLIAQGDSGNLFWEFVMKDENEMSRNFNTPFVVEHDIDSIQVLNEDDQPYTRPNPCLLSNCSHICALSPIDLNLYRCLCPQGMMLPIDDNNCQNDQNASKIIIGYQNTLKIMPAGIVGSDIFETFTLPNSVAIDGLVFNPTTNAVIINDIKSKRILQYETNDQTLTHIVDEELEFVSAIDLEVVSQNLYWIDSGKQTIEVMSLVSNSRAVLKRGLNNTFGIAVAWNLRSLFVAQAEGHKGILWKFGLDGKNETIFTSLENTHPANLFYLGNHDGDDGVLFWFDQRNNSMRITLTNTESTITFPPVFENPVVDMALIDPFMYWSEAMSPYIFHPTSTVPENDFIRTKLNAADHLTTSSIKLAVIEGNVSYLSDLFKNHECSHENKAKKSCSHICIPTENVYSGNCECSVGWVLDNDLQTCLDCLQNEDNELCWRIALLSFLRQKHRIISTVEEMEFRNGKKPLKTSPFECSHIFGVGYDEEKFEIGKHEFVKESSTIIGRGNFGVVFKSFMARFNSEVAVKSPKTSCAEEIRTVLCEIKILSYLGEHPNIVKLLGACTQQLSDGIVLVVMELCHNGSLLKHLKNIRSQLMENELKKRLRRYCRDIACGMEYLAEKLVIHGDVAARNVLMDENDMCKISDFGLSRKIERYTIYKKQSQEALPWAWLAFESLTRLEFTLKSDIWSMGVLYWEIFMCGEHPYSGQTCDAGFIENLKNGVRLPKPQISSFTEFKMMSQCWTLNPDTRPNASTLRVFFKTTMNRQFDDVAKLKRGFRAPFFDKSCLIIF